MACQDALLAMVQIVGASGGLRGGRLSFHLGNGGSPTARQGHPTLGFYPTDPPGEFAFPLGGKAGSGDSYANYKNSHQHGTERDEGADRNDPC